MKIQGGCFCGELAYEAEVDENIIGVCHCRDCQIFSGSAYRTSAMTAPDNFRITRGSPKHIDKVADSGNTRRMLFCGNCGTHLCSLPMVAEEGSFVSVRVATAKQFSQLKPSAELYCSSRVSWLQDLPGAAQFAGMPDRT